MADEERDPKLSNDEENGSSVPKDKPSSEVGTFSSNQNDELDFEEYESLEESEDGEVNSEDDLEEGEVVEGDDTESAGVKDESSVQTSQAPDPKKQQNKVSICRFFAKGQCTWGLNCRFLHLASPAPVVTLPLKLPAQRSFPYQGWFPNNPLVGVQPTGVHPLPIPPLNRHQAAALAGTSIHPPSAPQPSSSSSNPENAWSRGLRNAKEMIVKANKRKEEENDFEKNFNENAEDEGTSHSKHSHHSRESPESGDYGDRRSPPHNYHSREREKRSHRDYRESRDSRELREPRDLRERDPRNIRDKDNMDREARDDYYNNSEYERKRRLAFEAVPWNDEQSPPPAHSRGSVRPREAAEMYRDPWRRSKSPTAKWSGGRRTDVSTASKRSHSMSSISDSESGSNLSGSESTSVSGESFTGSEVTYSDGSGVSGRSPREKRQKSKTSKSSAHTSKHGNKTRSKSTGEPSSHHPLSGERGGGAPGKMVSVREKMNPVQASKNRSNRSSMEEESIGAIPRKKPVPVSPPPAQPPISKPRRDSWSDSDSGSMSHSESSHFSNSESGDSDAFSETSETHLEDDRRSKNYRNRRDVKPTHSSSSSVRPPNHDSARRVPQKSRSSPLPPPSSSTSSHHTSNAKRMKMSTSASTSSSSSSANREVNLKNRHSSSLANEGPSASTSQSSSLMSSKKSLHPQGSPSDGPKKNPIKMTFKKKHSNLKTDRVITAKLNGGKSNEESGEEEEETEAQSNVRLSRESPSYPGHNDADEDDKDDERCNKYYEKERRLEPPRGARETFRSKEQRSLSYGEASDEDGGLEEEEEDQRRGDNFKRDSLSGSRSRGSGERESRKFFSSPLTPPPPPTRGSSSSSVSKSKKCSERRSISPPSSPSASPTRSSSRDRREHLMKQLEAVEAMIAMKKAKLG